MMKVGDVVLVSKKNLGSTLSMVWLIEKVTEHGEYWIYYQDPKVTDYYWHLPCNGMNLTLLTSGSEFESEEEAMRYAQTIRKLYD